MREIQTRLKGRAFLIRFADDFVIGCELEVDARRLMEVLPKRFAKHGLTIHPEKTKLIEFGRPRNRPPAQGATSASPNTPPASKPGEESGSGKGTFDFLGFTHYWARSRKGFWVIQRRTSRKRLKRRQKSFWQWRRENRHLPLEEQYAMLCRKLRGLYLYAGIRGNQRAMKAVLEALKRTWRYWLSRRSHKSAIPWDSFAKRLERCPLPRPRIIHPI